MGLEFACITDIDEFVGNSHVDIRPVHLGYAQPRDCPWTNRRNRVLQDLRNDAAAAFTSR